jgi:hypothetical protein
MDAGTLKWAKMVGAKITDYPDGIQVIEHDDGSAFRRFNLKNGMLHNDRGPAIHTEYDGNSHKYWWKNDRPQTSIEMAHLNGMVELHQYNHKWELVNGKAIKSYLDAEETIKIYEEDGIYGCCSICNPGKPECVRCFLHR